ncbi:MAG: Beta-galactosidase [Planctomycetes bacterium ADurb.Bin126]|nr:MAG: Beta-galactosidase [Planctomycetes bacterium ADurb.Bin126]HOD82151.1 glycoside hydrolase family 2 TIM barrel-domain containing protein [Phycisphaerae bacterium]HQL72626.1 glycoside hydrolase family 2 TIM barrel-domain containing protein [Phycisphaerae bacterium]
MNRALLVCLAVCVLLPGPLRAADRVTIDLDGQWSIGESVEADAIPDSFAHTVPVPGLVHLSEPAFADVDQYETRDFAWTMAHWKVLPPSEFPGRGRTRQKRNYFWYRRAFTAPPQRQWAMLTVNKAQFSTGVWLNGKKLGEHLGCFTAGRFDTTAAIRWGGENTLLVRVGAHPGVMPEWAPWGNDGEKGPWTPGIYDSVSLAAGDWPAIESIQVAPKIATSEIVVQTRLRNGGPATTAELKHLVRAWKPRPQEPFRPVTKLSVPLAAGEEKTVTQTIPITGPNLWTPENPYLYVLESASQGDSVTTRFGMREFRFDTATRRAYLNGKVYYLRGASITLHRFFGDPLSKHLPWDEAWVRKLLVEIPRRMHWNAFRICIGPAPQKWLDIADEAGLLLQWEFPIWSDREPWYFKSYREDEMIAQFKDFMRDNWNHPSVAIWDASNETRWPALGERIIPAVRGLDLSNRPWEDGYNGPQGPDDPIEDHPYQFGSHVWGKPPYFDMPNLEKMTGPRPPPKAGGNPPHAAIINEYDWLWLHRDGMPTALTRKVYEHLDLLKPGVAAEQRFEAWAYRLAGLTEFWRAYRNYAGVLYLAYLDGDLPTCFTCDNFRNIEKLKFEPRFEHYMSQAFKPLGVYVNFWQPTLPKDKPRRFNVVLVNDTYEKASGTLELTWLDSAGKSAGPQAQMPFAVDPLGQALLDVELAAPAKPGEYVLTCKAFWDSKPWSPTIARRMVRVE